MNLIRGEAMFDDHLADLFGLEFDNWMEKNNVIAEFVSWSEIEVLPDDHPDHAKSLEEYSEDEETAVHLYGGSNGNIIITLNSATIVEKSEDFPEHLLNELKEMAINGPVKFQLKEL
jgi:hypothetical protein